MLRGHANSVFFNTSAASMLETLVLLKYAKDLLTFFSLSWTRHVAALFVTGCENALPDLRGDHILDADVR